MISVILTTHEGRKERCKRAIESVLAQTYKDFELVVVDDASHDGTDKMVREFKDSRIVYIHRTKNFGNDTKPKNEGILASKGELIAFLDSDNEYIPDHLMVLVKEMGRNSEADIVYGDRMVISDDEEMEPQVGIASDFNAGFLFERNFIDTSDVLIKREALFLVGGWDERYRKYVDWNLWVRMTKAGLKFQHISKVITYYHVHKDMKSLTVSDDLKVGEFPIGRANPEPIFKPQWDPFELEIQLPYLGDLRPYKTAIFTLTMDRLEYTKIMYKSLKKAGATITWVVVDQGSTDGTVKWLKSLKPDKVITEIKLILNKENKGISIGSNQALDAIGEDFDFIIKIDNDCELYTQEWLSRLLYIYAAHWQIVLSPYVEGLVDNPGGAPRLGYRTIRKHLLGMTRHVGGIFTMAHKSAYKGFRWDEDDFLHAMQDVVFSQEMLKKGFLTGYVEDMKCAHIDSTDGQKAKYKDYFEKRNFERTHTYK